MQEIISNMSLIDILVVLYLLIWGGGVRSDKHYQEVCCCDYIKTNNTKHFW